MSAWSKCPQCHRSVYGKLHHSGICMDCIHLNDDEGEVTDNERIRCPKCGHQADVYDSEKYDLMKDGGGDTSCDECGHNFHVNCWITYTYTSPPKVEVDA